MRGTIASWIYRACLRCYPEDLRRELGSEMLRTFADRMERRGTPRLLLAECLDAFTTGLHARIERARRRPPIRKGTRMELFAKDVGYAVRSLLRSPGFTSIALLSLALGIGANSATFSLVNAVLLKPLPVDRPEELVAVYATRASESLPLNLSYPNFRDLSEADVFADLVGSQGANVSFDSTGGEPELLWSELVTENYFAGLGVHPALGRTFLPEDAYRPVVVLSHDFWRRRFAARDTVLGTTLALNGRAFEVVGVARDGFTGAKFLGFTPDLWVPLTMHEVIWRGSEGRLERREGGWLNVRGRLKPGASIHEAEAALATVARRLEAEHSEINRDLRLHVLAAPGKSEPWFEVQIGSMLPIVSIVLLAVVAIVLLIACANVASLTMARTLGRTRELSVRLSLGASRARLARQLALESLVLVFAAGLVGFLLGEALLAAALGLGPVLDFRVDYGAETDWRVLLFTAAVTLFAGLVSGLVPALGVARRDVSLSLKEGGGGRASSRTAWRRLLVIPQVALSLVALVSAGLLVLSFHNARGASPGFEREGILLATVDVGLQGYDEEREEAFYRSLLDRVRGLAGVRSASLAFPLPLDAYTEGDRILPEGREPAEDDDGVLVFFSTVSEDYFQTMGTALFEGRSFEESDDASSPPVAVVNETLARRFWPGESAIGKRFRSADGRFVEVVGVAQDGKYLTLGEEPQPYLFVPLRQSYRSPMSIAVRTDVPPRSLEGSLRGAVRGLDPTLPVYGVKTIEQFLDRALAGPRALALSVTFFGLIALVLATVGMYGLISFAVSQKRHELGIRMALGASRIDVLGLFLKQAAGVIAIGVAAGLGLSWASTRILGSLLFGIEAGSPPVFAAVAAFLAAVALAGSFLPTRRALKLDPVVTLRHE